MGSDEGRGKLRNAMARCMQPLNHRFPNETSCLIDIPQGKHTQGSKALQYLKEKKSNEMLLVKAIEHSREQTESYQKWLRDVVLQDLFLILVVRFKVCWKAVP